MGCTCQGDGSVECSEEVIRSASQCLDNEGAVRAVGDVWRVECNTCRCTGDGIAACTLKLCNFGFAVSANTGPQCKDTQGGIREVGDEWKEGCNDCHCGEDAVEEAEIPRVKQCQDNSGSPRAVGDVWKVECNTCRCTDTGVAACTLKLCNFNLGGEQCRDKDGVSRSVGEEWNEGCNTCKCNQGGVPGCTKKICPTFNGCIGRLGEERQEGEEWFVQRAARNNQCQCSKGLVLCVAGSEAVAAPIIPSIRVTAEKKGGAKINFPEKKRAAAVGVRASRSGSKALLN